MCFGDNSSCIGDVNLDGALNVLDILILVNLIVYPEIPPTDAELALSDLSSDGILNVNDVVMLVNMVINGAPTDSDGDGVLDDEDSDPNNPYQCSDLDGDTCDDCSTGHYDTSDDGYDYDGDGQCDDGDCDDDNDGCNPGMTEDLNNGIDDDCDGAIDGGNIVVYTDFGLWEADTQLTSEVIDFEDMTLGYPVTDQYADLGVDFDGAIAAQESIDGAFPMDQLVGTVSGMTTTLTFEEIQYALSFYAVDVIPLTAPASWSMGNAPSMLSCAAIAPSKSTPRSAY
jgi:hypothetical protein